MTIAVDFDGVICADAWPEIGAANDSLIRTLIGRQKTGDKIILWTCRCGERLTEAVLFCKRNGLIFDAVNDNLPEHKKLYGNNSRKVFADEYWDDKAVKIYGTSCKR